MFLEVSHILLSIKLIIVSAQYLNTIYRLDIQKRLHQIAFLLRVIYCNCYLMIKDRNHGKDRSRYGKVIMTGVFVDVCRSIRKESIVTSVVFSAFKCNYSGVVTLRQVASLLLDGLFRKIELCLTTLNETSLSSLVLLKK